MPLKIIGYVFISTFLAFNLFADKPLIKQPQSKQHAFSPEDLLSLKRINEWTLSPDGKWIVYAMQSPDLATNKKRSDLYAITIDGSKTMRITDDDAADMNPVFSPKGDKLAFISTRSGTPQAYVMNWDKGTPKELTKVENGISSLAWSPDGQYISFASEVKMLKATSDAYPDLKKANVLMYDKLPVRHWDHWEDELVSHVFIMKTEGGTPVDIMANDAYDAPLMPFGGGEQIGWSPDSKEIAYTSRKVKEEAISTNSDIYIYNLTTRNTVNITEGMNGYDRDPLYSPDGNWIAFHSQERAKFEADRVRLMLYNRKTKALTDLSKSLDQWVGGMVWAPDSRSLYFSAGQGGTVPVYSISVSDGSWKVLTNGNNDNENGLAITPDGSTLVFGRTTMQNPTELFTMKSTGGEVSRVTGVNDELIGSLKEVKIEERKIRSKDGKTVHTWVVYPPDFDPNRKYPMIVYCQGGPQGTISNYFSYRWNLYLMASQGYVVVAPNRRGMPGFGQEWNDAISGDWGGGAMEDMLAATDEVSSEKFIDKSKLACVGASFGGFNVFWMAGNHNKRFSAFISHCGVFDFTSMYGSTEEIFFSDWEFGGPYWKGGKSYDTFSPHNYVEKWDTPMLIITGLKDFRVPYTQSLEAFTAAQLRGIPSKLLAFPEENHWVLGLQNALIWQKEFFGFLDNHLNNKK